MLLTTHYMFEADELCDRIAVIAGGEIVAEGTPTELKQLVSGGRVLEVETYGVSDEPWTPCAAPPGCAAWSSRSGARCRSWSSPASRAPR